MTVKEFVAAAGRKFSFGYAALLSLTFLCAADKLKESFFEMCFGALVVAVMGANYGEHREKQRAAAAGAAPEAK